MGMFVTKLWTAPQEFFLIVLVVVFSICLHEFCHAYAALLLGDSTAADRGHLTLNPLKQMGVFSIIMFLFLGIAWGSVPVDEQRLRARTSYGPLLVSLAGPFANFMLALISYCLFGVLQVMGPDKPGSAMVNLLLLLFLFGVYNIVLMLLNLIPAPGLDGWAVARALFPKMADGSSETLKGILIFLIFAAFFCLHYLFTFGMMIMKTAYGVFYMLLN
jgi:Zn-dependent protease